MKTVLLLATLDTKGTEIGYIAERLGALGVGTRIIDMGVLGEPVGCTPDITRAQVAEAAGTTINALRVIGTRGAAIERMRVGVARVVADLFAQGQADGMICLGGAEGSVMGGAAAQALPIGVPKIIVSPIASGVRAFGPLVGRRDVMVVHSLIDILGINPISAMVFDNVVAAMAGMLQHGHALPPNLDAGGPYVAATMNGNTTRGMMVVKDLLAQAGYELVIFHSNGVGGPIMEELMAQNMFVGVIDATLNELSEPMLGGFQSAPERLQAAGQLGLPQVVVPGCVDFACFGPPHAIPERYRDRPAYHHNPEFTLVRLTAAEQAEVGATIGQRLSASTGPVHVLIPLGGVSVPDVPGGAFYDPTASAGFRHALKTNLRADIPVTDVDAHINDPRFAHAVAEAFVSLMTGDQGPKTKDQRPKANDDQGPRIKDQLRAAPRR